MNTILLYSPNIWLIVVIGLVLLGIIKWVLAEKRKTNYDDTLGSISTHTSIFNKGVVIGRGRITRKRSFLHTSLIATSGGGKTSGVLIPTALGLDNCSIIFLDPAKELFEKTAGALAEKGFTIKVIDFLDVSRSIGFNPLLRAKTNTELNMLAEMILAPSMRNTKDIFWPTMAAKLLVLIFKIQLLLPEEFRNLANTLYLLNLMQGSPKQLDKLVATVADDKLFTEYKAMIAHDSKLLSNILASAQSALKIFEDENVAKVTSFDTLDLTAFRHQKTVLYVNINIMSARYYSFLVEILFRQIFDQFMAKLPTNELDCFMLLDEMGSITVKGFAEALANLRKYRVSVTYAVQSRNQLIERMGREDALTCLANSYHQLIFPGMETDLAQELQTRMGKWSFEREDGTRSTREIMTVSELVHLEEGYAIYTAGPARPMKVKLHPYYKNFWMRKKASLPPPIIKGEVPDNVAFVNPAELKVKTEKENAF